MSQPAAQEKDAPSADHSSEKAAPPDVPNLTHGQETNVLEVVNADYALALSTGPQLSPTSWASIELFGILLVAYMGSLSNGFDGSVMSAVNGMHQYLDFFGIDGQDAGGGVGTTTAIIFGIYSIGSIAAVMLAGPVTDRFGRRGGMCLGSTIIIIGAIVITAARDASYLLGGRFTLGFGVAITTTAAPAYVVEMSPPQSPRWLISQGRNDEARRILAKYHGNGDPNAPLVQLEWREFEEAIKLDASDKRWWDYKELVNTPNARYRTFMMLLMGFFGQWSGNGLGYFLPILFQNAGANSQNQRLTLNFINTVVSAIGALIGTSLADKVGRRRMWFWGTLASAGTLAVTTGCTARFGSSGSNVNGANAAIAFIFLFGFVYSLTYTPLQAIYPAEVLSYNTRAKGMAMYALAVSCASFVNTYPAPIALGRIQWRYYIVYVVWDVLEAIMVYFFAVETKGRTLEELDEIFSDPHPVRASLAKKKVVIVEKDDRKEVVKVLEP
ncbi:hypothetical protein PTI98_005290 [Pleurotus ostreatus]|nr:hypothetical protein PTI98_005290 [Pleurotus ostreatus]